MNNLLYGLLGLALSTQAFSGYVAEFHFGDDSFVRPITKSIKISEFIGIGEGVDNAKVIKFSHKIGDTISPGEIFSITVDDSDNKNYIPSQSFASFVNGEKLEDEEYKKYFRGIVFEVENTKFSLEWAQLNSQTLRLLGGAGDFSWGCFERSGYPSRDRKSGMYHHLIECGFYSRH